MQEWETKEAMMSRDNDRVRSTSPNSLKKKIENILGKIWESEHQRVKDLQVWKCEINI